MHLCAGGQVERNDGELAVPLPIVHQVEEGGGDDVDTSEGEFPVLRFLVVEACRFHLSGGLVYPAVQVVVVVKKEIAGSLALAHEQPNALRFCNKYL